MAGKRRIGSCSTERSGSRGPTVSRISARPSPSSSAQPRSPKPKDITPEITFGWGYATVSLHTKKIKGLHENDFIMAAKLDRITAEGVQVTA